MIELREGYVVAGAPVGLRGARIEFPAVSVGATEHALMAAVLAKGETLLVNAAREPEIEDLGRCLQAMGARISGLGGPCITIEASTNCTAPSTACCPTASRPAPMRWRRRSRRRRRSCRHRLRPDRRRGAASRSHSAEIVPNNRGLKVRRNGVRRSRSMSQRRRSPLFPPTCRRSSWR